MADRLSMDSSAALAAGMSYGQYKALHPHTEFEAPARKPRRVVPMIECDVCGVIFRSRHGKKCCSEECSYEKIARRAAEKYRRDVERKKMKESDNQ